jgi:aryl-alcohol dehydrogenase-like predicted oxidoreductase
MALTRRRFASSLAALPLAACSAEPEPAVAQSPSKETRPLLTRAIPSTGEQVPVIGLGTWQAFDIGPSDPDWGQARETLRTFFDGGGRVVDSSPMYGRAEAAIGALAAELGIAEPLFLATKVWTRGRAPGIAQMEDSLALLKVARLDLMQVHNLLDLETHLATLAEWKAAGRVRLVGVTHYTEGAYDALERAMRRHALDFIQINYSVAEPDSEERILPLAHERGMAVLVNRPFAGGDVFSRVRRLPLPEWAAELEATSWAQILLKFVLAHPAVTCAIPGTRNPRHVADNLGAGAGPLPGEAQRRRIVEAVRRA